jgi:transcriptional regulator with XRE-family HTH domain
MVKNVLNKELFAARLKGLMDESGETVYSIADIVHLTAPTISRYLNAGMAAKITTVEALARHFKVNPVWLMGGDVSKDLEDRPEPDTVAAHLGKIKLTDEEKAQLDDYIQFLISKREKK